MGSVLYSYLNRQNINSVLINEHPDKQLETIVIIPAFNEPDIINTLTSLKQCVKSPRPIEIIIYINNSDEATEDVKIQNRQTFVDVNVWIEDNSSDHLKYHCVINGNLPKKHAGAGLARKIVMDEAIRRFALVDNSSGVIASLDADTLVSVNYLAEIQNVFNHNTKLNCSIFNFAHQISDSLNTDNQNAIILYELYLRYFKQALKYTGFPYAFHTIGSCFAVKASIYAKQGGMNRKKGGEDFYFLHKIFPLGNSIEANSITVFPSSRLSDRVPFGTGPAIRKIIEDGELLTYNPICFKHIKYLFSLINVLYKIDNNNLLSIYKTLDSSIQLFIKYDDFETRIDEINNNSSTLESFTHRFFQWFDAFKVIKYLNLTHATKPRIAITNAATELLCYKQITYHGTESAFKLLKIYRDLDKKQL